MQRSKAQMGAIMEKVKAKKQGAVAPAKPAPMKQGPKPFAPKSKAPMKKGKW